MSNCQEQVGIIGAGLGGLAAACTLAARGYSVTVFDKNEWTGGKAAVLSEHGFRFDMGPTILTMPEVLKRLFLEAGKDMEHYLDLTRLDPQWRCFFGDGSKLDLIEDISDMSRNIESFCGSGSDSDGYQRFMALAQRLHEISERFFFWKPVEDLRDTFDFKKNLDLKTLRDVLALRMGHSVAGTIRSNVQDRRLAQMLDHFTQYVGSSPFLSPAVLCSIAHIQTQGGVWYPSGGTKAVSQALTQLARELGVSFRPGENIQKINTISDRVTGIKSDSGIHKFDAVVSNMDSVRTYCELLDTPKKTIDKLQKREPACSGVVLYLGLKQGYEHLLHHNFIFSDDPEQEFEAIYRNGELAPDPTCYVAAPARTDSSVAPPGGEALYVLVHTPYLRDHHDWSEMFPKYRRTILRKLAKTAKLDDLESRIIYESRLTPDMIHQRYKVLNGAIYGLASHGKYMGAFKPGNRSRSLEGLYLCGGSAHPGPGMPMAMMSGWIAGDALDKDFQKPDMRSAQVSA